MKDTDQLEAIASVVLKAAGSGFQHYMPSTKEKILSALSEILAATGRLNLKQCTCGSVGKEHCWCGDGKISTVTADEAKAALKWLNSFDDTIVSSEHKETIRTLLEKAAKQGENQ